MDDYMFPENLTELTDEQLAQAAAAATEEANRIIGLGTDATDADLDLLDRLAELIDTSIPGVRAERETAAAERQQRLDSAAQRIESADGGAGDGDGGEGDGDDAPADEPAADEPAADDAPEAIAAGATRVPTRRQQSPTPVAPDAPSGFLTIRASAIDHEFERGQVLTDTRQLAAAMTASGRAFDALPTDVPGVYDKRPVARLSRNYDRTPDFLSHANPDYSTIQALFAAAASERRLKDGSLVAAGGWCAPSENRYDLCQQETLDGIIDLPEVGVPRGGLNYTPGPTFADIYTDAGFFQTEAQAIAGDTKPCTEIDCPDFAEVRLDAVGICVKAPLLTRSAYPEAVQRWIEGTIVANQHKVAGRLISAMRTALGTALAPTLTGTPVTWSTLSYVEWIIEMQRQAHRLSESEALEVKAPRWFRAVLRADLANRNGMIAAERVTNQMIADHFADRGAVVDFILNYLEVSTPLTSVAYPSTVELMIYPAGTFVKGTQDVISLDTIYDTANLQTNVFTAAFVEDGVLLAKMCHGGARVTIPVHVTGQLGATDIDQTLGTAQVNADG